jgi:5-methylcytosine-specific restriction endonuclease McrA
MRKTYAVLEPITRVLHTPVPRLQRLLSEDHVDQMVRDQSQEYDANGCFSMLQSITIGVLESQRYIIDGQHRMSAFAKLQQLGYPVHDAIVPVIVYNAQTKEELAEYFNRINKNMPIHPFELHDAWENVGKRFCELFAKDFGVYLKNGATRCKCPHISLDELKHHVAARDVSTRLMKISKTVDDLWSCIVQFNSSMYTKMNDQMCPTMHKRLQSCHVKSQRHHCVPCFLGAWRHFEWLDITLYQLEHPGLPLQLSSFTQTSVRTKIPATLREQIWKKHNKNTCDEGECFVCGAQLRFADMECGHVIPHALGGSTSVDNLMPVCRMCNRDMGIMNLMHYKNMLQSIMSSPMDTE